MGLREKREDSVDWKKGQEPFDVGRMTCLKTTAKAILVEGKLRDGRVGELWAPKSVLHKKNKVKKKGDVGRFVVQTWWGEANL
jgi:hypothetical protein